MSDHPASRARLTVAILMADASVDAGATLDSADALADELLVVSLGGGNLPVPTPLNARTIVVDDADDPAAARNLALQQATGDWLLWLEAGESVRAETAKSLRAWLASDAARDQRCAYLVWIEAPASSLDESPEQVAVPRLLPCQAGVEFSGRVRETIVPALDRLGLTLKRSDWRICEGSDALRPDRRLARARRQLRLANLELQTSGMNPRALTASADAHAALGDPVKATQHNYQALRLADRGSVEMLTAYYGLLATFRGDESDHRQRLAVCLEALETYPLDAQLLLAMGTFLQQQNHLELASRSFRAAVEIGEVEPRAPHLKDVRAIAAVSWSLMLQLRGEMEQALDVLRAAVEKFPHARNLARRRLELLVQLGRDVEALACAATVSLGGAGQEALRIGLRGACLAAQGNWIPALTYLRTAYDAACRDPICLRWYAVGLVALGQLDAARPILHEWHEVAPHDAEVRRYLAEFEPSGGPKTGGRDAKQRTVRVDAPAAGPELHGGLPQTPPGVRTLQG